MGRQVIDWGLGPVLRNDGDNGGVRGRLEMMDGVRFLVLRRHEYYRGHKGYCGWIAIPAPDLHGLHKTLEIAHESASSLRLGEMEAVEIPCEIGDQPTEGPTRALRMLVEQQEDGNAITLRHYNLLGDKWCLEEYQCELGLSDLATIMASLKFRIDRLAARASIGER